MSRAPKHTVVIGAGPAGLAAAYHLSGKSAPVTVLEMDSIVGGIARTVEHKGFRFDLGGHRFFTKMKRIDDLWTEVLGDDLLLRPRSSQIFYRGQFMDYPLRASSVLRTLGALEMFASVGSYFWNRVFPVPEDSFEGWVTNRFGRRLYQHFFKTYTEKAWGMPCSELSADWAAQRIKSLSLWGAMVDALSLKSKAQHTTLIQEFRYPALGPGMMWQRFREVIEERGGRVLLGRRVMSVRRQPEGTFALTTESPAGEAEFQADTVISSMPLGELVRMLEPAAEAGAIEAAGKLRHRAFMCANLIVRQEDPFSGQWIYVHDPQVRVARVQNFKNWSPQMVPDPTCACIGAEYFVWPEDDLWQQPDAEVIELATKELAQIGIIDPSKVVDGIVVRSSHAYPVYDAGYKDHVRCMSEWLQTIENLWAIGRNGQHRYNNMDHSMMTGLLSAENVLGAGHDVWDINVEQDYLEEGQDA